MSQEDVRELPVSEYAELVNGRVAGLRLAFVLFLTDIQDTKSIRAYIKSLENAKGLIETGIKNGEFQFSSRGYPDGTLDVLEDLIESLNSSLQTITEIEDDVRKLQ